MNLKWTNRQKGHLAFGGVGKRGGGASTPHAPPASPLYTQSIKMLRQFFARIFDF